MSAPKRWSTATRCVLAYTLSLLITPVTLIPFIPGTAAFLYALVAVLVTNAVVGALVARALHRSGCRLGSWESKLMISAVTTSASCSIGLGLILLGG